MKNTVAWTYIISDLNGKDIIGSFYGKELQKTNQKEFRIEKVIKKKELNCMSDVKDLVILLISGLIKKTYYKSKQNKIGLNALKLDYFLGKRFFDYDGQQNYLVFQLMYEYFKRTVVLSAGISTIYVNSWTSKGISNEVISAPNNNQSPIFGYKDGKIGIFFEGSILNQARVTCNHGPKVSIFIVHKLNSPTISTDFALKDCLFGSV